MTIVSPMGQLRPVFADKNGKRLSGGKVFTYEPGTLTPKPTYSDAFGALQNTNPINLDESGEADIYLDGDYRFMVLDRYGTTILDRDNFRTWASGIPASSVVYGDKDLGQFSEQVESGLNNRYTKDETLSKAEFNAALAGVSGGYFKTYTTLALANADIANIPLNVSVRVSSATEGGDYEKLTAGATTLTKSAYDPVEQSKLNSKKNKAEVLATAALQTKFSNLFDVSSAQSGYAIDSNGVLFVSTNNTVSDFINILPTQSYIFSIAVGIVAFYDIDKVYISQQAVSASTVFTSPENAYFLRFHQPTTITGLASQMLIKGSTLPTRYIAFGYVDHATAKRNELTNARAVLENATPQGLNLFDKSRATQNFAMGGTGVPYAISGWFVTDFIAVKSGNNYISNKQSGNNGGAEYDENGVFLRLFTVTANTAFTVSADAFFIRFQVSGLTNLDSLMVCSGSVIPSTYKNFVTLQNLQDSMTTVSKSFDAIGSKQASRPNLFDIRTAKDNTALASNGSEYAAADNFATARIPVSVGDNVFVTTHFPLSNNIQVVFRNSGVFVSHTTMPLHSSIVVPANVDSVQFSMSNMRRKQSLHISIGTTKPSGYRSYLLTGDKPNQDAQIALLGDSFTDQTATAGGWQPYFINRTGATIIANFARAGRQVKDALKSADGSRDLNVDDFANATHVVIPLGTNDYGANRPLGTIADAVDGTTANTFYADVYKVLWQLFTWKPTLRVLWATPTIRGQFVTTPAQPFYPAANSAGVTLQQYRQAIIEVCALFGVRVADQFANSGFNLVNILTVTDDGLHPNVAVGQPLYGHTLAAEFNKL